MFGKIMSINDDTMWDYYRLLLEVDGDVIARHKEEHPMDAKKNLAVSLTAMFHSLEAARHEREQFEQVFSKNKLPDDMPVFSWREIAGEENQLPLTEVLSRTKLFPSKKEVRRLIEQGAVKLNEEKAADPFLPLEKPEAQHILQAGKRTFVKIVG
ncbi:MAG: S4 domain-containing protein [Verrucomicrobiota bacterium JB024]|nr:S4 domain-containing protein [Verrucomicrobiota bacterium JB024]